MLAAWIALPLPLRLVLLGLLGLIAGSFANWAIYAWAYFKAPISPWSRPLPSQSARPWYSRLPVVGWWARGSEAPAQLVAARERLTKMGYLVPKDWKPRLPFWVRPMLIELSLGFALPWLYWYETETGQLLPLAMQGPAVLAMHSGWFHWMFLGHAGLLLFMVIATFIDFDEQMIPDMITIPGTLLALLWATLSLETFLPILRVQDGVATILPCTFAAPWPLSADWMQWPGLAVGLALWSGWCFALSTRVVILRRGLRKAVRYFFALMRRDPMSKWLLLIWAIGVVAVAGVWSQGGTHWHGLLTGLVGLAIGGGTIWAVRLVAGAAMGEEAMGFGDVTLMAMIGAIVGWQATGVAFFIAPLTSIFIVLIAVITTGQRATPFGPYLCAGTVVTVLFWPTVWSSVVLPALLLGPTFLIVMLVSLLAMGVLLGVWRTIKQRLFVPAE